PGTIQKPLRLQAKIVPSVKKVKGLSKIKLAHSSGILLAKPAWRKGHGTHGLTQVAVHRDSEIAQGQRPTAVYGPHRQRTGSRGTAARSTGTRVGPHEHSQRAPRTGERVHLPRCLCGTRA